jgi:hypothetical protein
MIKTAIVGGISTIAGAAIGSRSARKAADSQARSAELGVQEQRRQFDAATQLFQPYVQAGVSSLGQQQALLGLAGPEAQAQAISQIESGPQFQSLVQQGEAGILANASATGGLRGGNVQGALGQFRPQMLNALIQQQFQDLGSITTMGQASAGKQAAAGQVAGTNIANLYGQQGAAQAGAQVAQGKAFGSALGDISNLFGMYKGFQATQPPPLNYDTLGSLPVLQPYQPTTVIPTFGGS